MHSPEGAVCERYIPDPQVSDIFRKDQRNPRIEQALDMPARLIAVKYLLVAVDHAFSSYRDVFGVRRVYEKQCRAAVILAVYITRGI